MKIKKVFRPFAIFQIPTIEAWLKVQAQNGYELIRLKGCIFSFVNCKPETKEYFLYKSPLLDKNDKFLNDFFMVKSLYKKRKSILNKKNNIIIEIDPKKVDGVFKHYHISRIKHYLRYHLKVLLVKTLFCAFFIVFYKKMTLWFVISFMSATYSIISIIILRYKEISQNNS